MPGIQKCAAFLENICLSTEKSNYIHIHIYMYMYIQVGLFSLCTSMYIHVSLIISLVQTYT